MTDHGGYCRRDITRLTVMLNPAPESVYGAGADFFNLMTAYIVNCDIK